MGEELYDRKKKGKPGADVDIHEIMNRWRTGVKCKQRGIASFRERIEQRMGVVQQRIFSHRVTLDDWAIRTAHFRGLGEYEIVEDWRPFRLGDQWGDEGLSAFFRRRAEMPKEFAGRKVLLRIYVGGDSLLRVDGVPYHGVDPFHNEVLLAESAKGDEVYEFELESFVAWHAEKRYPFTFALAELAAVDEQVHQAYWDLRAVVKALEIDEINPKLREFLETHLWEALKMIPLQEGDPERMRRCIQGAAESVRNTIYASDRFRGEGLMHLVAHSHLDVVFMWPYREFVRKIGRTHATMLRLMERYPEFTFCQSQAKLYADMKEHFPDLYAQVHRRVAEGRWELTGAFWVEPDCNLISGESFVRQILYGQKFFEEEFGRRSRSCWQPDVFGLSWAMPQILARSGIEYFMTNKMAIWNDTNPWTKNTFWWEGMDGSRVLSFVPPGHFIGTVDPDIMDRQWRAFSDKDTLGETLHIYGWGDGGGGPDAEMIECGRRYRDFPGLVKTKFSTAEEAFDSIHARAERSGLPVVRDELYLEAHRGTYTNKARLKKLNRRMEFLYREAELAAALALLAGGEYPADELRRGWEALLTTQFHDSLPGTHITEVYHDLLAELEGVRTLGEGVRDEALSVLVGPRDDAGRKVVVFNSLLHARADCLALPAKRLAGRAVADARGEPLPQQEVINLDGTRNVLVRAGEIPPVGYRTFDLVDAKPPADTAGAVKAMADSLENDFLKATFNSEGELVSLWDKEREREVLVAGEVGNRLQMFEDTPGHYDAWDLADTYRDHEIDIAGGGTLSVDENGPVRASLLLEKPVGRSKVRQRISLYAGSRQLVFETHIDWVERQRILKVGFPVEINTTYATYDIAFGNMARPNHRNTPYDAARFEVPAHQWMALSQGDYGVSLLNDCKYGHEADGKLMRLSLLKGSIYPDPEADKEAHDFTYALYPHAGSWREAGTIREALNLNCPLLARFVAQAPAEADHSFIRCDAPGVTLEAVKRAEDGEGLVVRLVERLNGRARGRLVFDRPVRKAWSCNLMEEKEDRLKVRDGAVEFVAKPYEIVTVRAAF